MLARGLLLFLALSAVSASDIQFEIFEPQAGQEYAKDQEIVLSFQGTGWPKNDKRADLLLNKKKLRDLPLPKKDGEVFNVTLTGVKKGRHEFEVVLYHGKDVKKEKLLDVWGSFFFVGAETARINTKLQQLSKKAGTPEWAGDTLLTWLVSKGSDVEKLEIKDDKASGGVGVFATENVKAGEVIAEIPYLASIGPESAAKHTYSEFLLTLYGDKDFPGQFAAAFHLLLEVGAESSPFDKYIQTLPLPGDERLGVAVNWDRHDYMRAARVVPLLSKDGHTQQEFFDRGYERFWAVLDMHEKKIKNLKKAKKMPKLSLFTRGNVAWAVSIILTRGFRCPNSPDLKIEGYTNRPNGGLYRVSPPTDSINFFPYSHDPYPVPKTKTSQVYVVLNNTESKTTIHALKDVEKGSQLLMSVGELTNTELLVQYGFIRRPNLIDIDIKFPEWVRGKYSSDFNQNARAMRLALAAPGADPFKFFDELNATIPSAKWFTQDNKNYDKMQEAMSDLFEAAIANVPHGGEEQQSQTCKGGPEKCGTPASKLVRDAVYIARTQMTVIDEDEVEVEAAWEKIKGLMGDYAAEVAELPSAPVS